MAPSATRRHEDPPLQPLTYASLPPTPILPSSPAPSPPPSESGPSSHAQSHQPLFSLWDYLREELLATDFDSHQELKWERVSNFLRIPFAIEKIIGFGFLLCLDSFLYTFTIQPIRFFIAASRSVYNLVTWSKSHLPPSQKADILRTLLVVVSITLLIPLADASKIYHSIRGQDTIKLYVIFNSLEIADRLCASIGQDILDCLFSRSTLEVLSHRAPFSSRLLRPLIFFILATLYVAAHTLVMLYQLLSLNVAVNSYDHALLTLLVSNQFVEIKGCVFKKFEKDNLFQITCADIVERFTLSLMLVVVAFRNLIELSGSEFDFTGGFVMPKSYGWFRGNNVLWTISYPVVTVLVSEMMVDWLKHAFIIKFNHIRPSVYERYIDVLCRDLASGSIVGRHGPRKHTYVDQSPLVARRLGLASVPLAVLAILISLRSFNLVFSSHLRDQWDLRPLAKWIMMGLLFWLCFLALKVLLGINLISYAGTRKTGMEARIVADHVNDFGRDPIGEGAEEREYNKQLQRLVNSWGDDAVRVSEIGEGQGTSGQKRVPLEDLTRFTMVKRIW
ncbi:eukaryotic membrane protein family-domain-containing protein [Boletus reticuloceps]|uniref:Eukaryotic membrane protein family-domain-containing protein n=1 Tax=Boletus reticuloceps TaxID=495285 RepID=A0A8I2YD72_9AGAM|nr:eukaryotic membrane protein family-domain-containing protein [Boletus reticuloceps]